MKYTVTILLLMFSFGVFSQRSPGTITGTKTLLVRAPVGVVHDSIMGVPMIDTTLSDSPVGSIVKRPADTLNSNLYIKQSYTAAKKWYLLGGGSTPTLQQVTTAGNITTNQVSIHDGAGDSIVVKPTQIEAYATTIADAIFSPGYIYAQSSSGGIRWLAGNAVGMKNASSAFNTELKNINPSASNEFYLRETNTGSHTDTISNLTDLRIISTQYTSTATGFTLGVSNQTVEVTATGQTITLPTAVGITGRVYTIKLTASGSGTVATTSSQNIDASTTYSLASQYKYVTVQSNGANWIVIANN